MKRLFNGASIADRGTLAHLKNYFQHKNVSTDVMNNFNHVDNFMRFIAESHITYLAMYKLNMNKLSDTPLGSTPNEEREIRQQYFEQVCCAIVNEVWLLPSPADVADVIESEVDGFVPQDDWCFCEDG